MAFDEFLIDSLTDEEIEKCKLSKNIHPLLFDRYKHVGGLCLKIGALIKDGSYMNNIENKHYGILVGLLMRCGRLMHSSLVLINAKNQEIAFRIINRCILETAVNIRFLILEGHNAFDQYVYSSLRSDLALKKIIEANAERRGQYIPLERRMLSSISRLFAESGVKEGDIPSKKRKPDLKTILSKLGYSDDLYVVMQQLGSQPVHGDWSELMLEHIKFDGLQYTPKESGPRIVDSEYILPGTFVLEAIKDHLQYCISDIQLLQGFLAIVSNLDQDFQKLLKVSDQIA